MPVLHPPAAPLPLRSRRAYWTTASTGAAANSPPPQCSRKPCLARRPPAACVAGEATAGTGLLDANVARVAAAFRTALLPDLAALVRDAMRAELASSSATATTALAAPAPDPAAAAVTHAYLAAAEACTVTTERGSGFMVGTTTPPGAEAKLIASQVLPPREACRAIFRDVTLALCHLHVLGVHHGDIKPENALVPPKSKRHSPALDTPEHRLVSYSTHELSAPQLLPNLAVSAASSSTRRVCLDTFRLDVYALGLLLFTLLHGPAGLPAAA
ncbi:hypothetical protein HK405_006899 [Cladochytrium tenue]|nr:hypothetical protein HK405_006899 [Cladochytrium tenue]